MLLVIAIVPVRRAAFTDDDFVRRLLEPTGDADLGDAIRESLARGAQLELRDDYNRSDPELRASGLRRQSDFKRDARLVFARFEAGDFTLRPTENEFPVKPRGGFGGWPTAPVWTLSEPTDAELGRAAREALAACRFAEPNVRRDNARRVARHSGPFGS